MTNEPTPETFGATIDPAASARFGQFLDATNEEIANQLLQNARRAGARHETIEVNDSTIVIEDDGCGIEPSAIKRGSWAASCSKTGFHHRCTYWSAGPRQQRPGGTKRRKRDLKAPC